MSSLRGYDEWLSREPDDETETHTVYLLTHKSHGKDRDPCEVMVSPNDENGYASGDCVFGPAGLGVTCGEPDWQRRAQAEADRILARGGWRRRSPWDWTEPGDWFEAAAGYADSSGADGRKTEDVQLP